MTRFFSFGCSFTRYWRWPTWADAIGQQAGFFENWGVCGGGNPQILYNLIECHTRNKIDSNDTVMIMWTSTSRQDHYVRDHWHEGGNIYWTHGNGPPKEYIEKFACERGFLIRDLATISAVRDLLMSWKCQWRFLAMVPLTRSNRDNDLGEGAQTEFELVDVYDLYKDVLESMAPSVYETVFQNNWFSGQGIPDTHTPSRRDFHPTPQEHLYYLNQVCPDISISPATQHWMLDWQQKVLAGDTSWEKHDYRPKKRL
jgi:hypothetical protein